MRCDDASPGLEGFCCLYGVAGMVYRMYLIEMGE